MRMKERYLRERRSKRYDERKIKGEEKRRREEREEGQSKRGDR